jgi:hypothetical protein
VKVELCVRAEMQWAIEVTRSQLQTRLGGRKSVGRRGAAVSPGERDSGISGRQIRIIETDGGRIKRIS